MSSPASIRDHPIHPMLVALPIGLFVFSLVSDIIYIARWGGIVWTDVAYYTMIGGVVTALIAAVPGFIDYLSITDIKTKQTGTKHLIANLTVIAVYVVNAFIRRGEPSSMVLPFSLSIIGVAILAYSGWLGGDMIYEHGMAVELEQDGKLKKGRRRPYDEHEKGHYGEAGHIPAPRAR